jgi:hypothetical protein
LREEGSLDYDGRLVRLQVYLNFNTNIHRSLFQGSQAPPGSMTTPSFASESSGGGAGPSSLAVSSATPFTQAASLHERHTIDVTSGAPDV